MTNHKKNENMMYDGVVENKTIFFSAILSTAKQASQEQFNCY